MKLWPTTFLIISCITSLTLVSCKKEQKQMVVPQTTVEVTNPQIKDIPEFKEWVAKLNGKVNATIRAQVTGYLMEQCYHNGQFVKKDQELFLIDKRTFQAALEQAEGSLAQAEASRTKNQLDVDRYRPLVETNAVSRKQLDDAIQATREAEASVQSAQAAVDSAKLNRDFTTIKSPIDGIAGIAKAQIGDLVGQSGPVLTEVSAINPIRLDFALTEKDWLKTGLKLPRDGDYSKIGEKKNFSGFDVLLTTGNTYEYKAHPVAINREVNNNTGTISIEGELENPNLLLRPGMSVRVRAQVNVVKGVLVVPKLAVISQQGAYYVVTVDEQGAPTIVPVNPGAEWQGEQVVYPMLEGSLSPQSKVVVIGTLRAMMAAPKNKGDKAKENLKMVPYTPNPTKALMSVEEVKNQNTDGKDDSALNIPHSIPQA